MSARRYWYSAYGSPKFACGWAFGETWEAARDAALAAIRRWSPQTRGAFKLHMQHDHAPYVDAPNGPACTCETYRTFDVAV